MTWFTIYFYTHSYNNFEISILLIGVCLLYMYFFAISLSFTNLNLIQFDPID